MTNKILAAVVTYNRKALLKECIESLLKQSYKYFDILIVDNASTDGTEEELKPMVEAGTILYHNTGENLGGAGGFNKAMRIAVEEGYEYVWVMDDDTIPTEEALIRMLVFMSTLHNKWGFLSGKALWIDGSICKMNIHKLTKEGLCREATFVSMLLPTRIIRELGLPIKDFFIWADDIEYSLRISKHYPCYFVDNSIVVHKTNNNMGTNIALDKADRMDRYRYAFRNEVYIAIQNGKTRIVYQFFRIIHNVLRVIGHRCDKKMKRIRLILSASFEGLSFHPEVEYVKKTVS